MVSGMACTRSRRSTSAPAAARETGSGSAIGLASSASTSGVASGTLPTPARTSSASPSDGRRSQSRLGSCA
jgi:hypothetical protein